MNLKEKRNGFQGGYGKLVTRGREYSYDEEGNLSEKKEANGSTWRYLYYGNGKLKEVIRPDQSSVCFQYEFVDAKGFKKVTVLHTSDPNIPTHAHAGEVPSGGNQYTYDFQKPGNRYDAIDDVRYGKDHHLKIGCKG